MYICRFRRQTPSPTAGSLLKFYKKSDLMLAGYPQTLRVVLSYFTFIAAISGMFFGSLPLGSLIGDKLNVL